MALTGLVFAAVIAFAASAAVAPIPAPVHPAEFNPHPQYQFNYAVQEPTTGDFKTQSETRDGDAVHGRYTVLEPNGLERVVEYTADDVHGFNAVVSHTPAGAAHAAPAPVAKVAVPVAAAVVPAKIAAPAVKGFAPFAHSGYHGYPGYSGYHGYPGYSGYHGYPGYAGYPGYSGFQHGFRSPFYSGYHPGHY
ncbi:cuticle protein 7-like [Photinus pyralis]|uniref:cuticle protein 7-like n=1 Tax=Photinus pyralis TaxID=7054 RepID=UPI0012677590|nr:cuticle protein 7-like [Photinus pyralis]